MPAPPADRSTRSWRATPVVAYLLGFVFIGLAVGIVGPALSHLRDRVGTDDGGIGLVFVGVSVGYIGASLFAGRVLDAGAGHLWWCSAMVVGSASVLVVANAASLPVLVAAFIVLGACCGLSDVCGNTLVVWSRPDGAGSLLNALHLCFAVGSLAAPVVVNRTLYFAGSLWGAAIPLVVLTGICGWLMLRHEAPRRTRLERVQLSEDGGNRTLHVAVVCGFFFAYVALEAGFVGWIHTYVEQIRYGGSGTATGVITTFWAGFTLGRVVSIRLARSITPGWIVAGAVATSVVSSVLFLAFRGPGPMLWVVTFLFAVSVAPQYASMMAFAEAHLALSGRNTGAIIAASGLGGLVLPWLLGQLFDAIGPEALPSAMVVAALLTAVVGWYAGRLLLASHRPPVTSTNAPVT